ncbi:MAG: 4a-hydroxytetrahydrobiopterin dehydratase [Phycisphaerales bacterium]|nr:4a-hydroxytetrahydrobiopterin dehydratase [Phycisphaerales bacterium]
MTPLSKRTCTPHPAGAPPLRGAALRELAAQAPQWTVVDDARLQREFRFPDFAAALAFTNAVGAVAEGQDHHPDIYLGWGKVRVELWTHSAGGLTEADFIVAARIDGLVA